MNLAGIQFAAFPFAPLIVWAIAKLLWNLTREKREDAPERIRRIHKPSAYLSNGKLISVNHRLYYFNILGLNGRRGIDDDEIRDATRRVQDEHMPSWVNSPPSVQDIKAARSYLLDQYYYVTAYN